jgi:V/A-type H+-transporting ATPase subunit I
MIVPMFKYGFLIYHRDFEHFLDEIQRLGVLHIIRREHEPTEEIVKYSKLVSLLEQTIQFLEKRIPEKQESEPEQSPTQILEKIATLRNQLELFEQDLAATRAELRRALPWGEFSSEQIQQLEANNLHLKFYTTSLHKFAELTAANFTLEIIRQNQQSVYFAVIWQGDDRPEIDAEEFHLPERAPAELEKHTEETGQKITAINHTLDGLAGSAVETLKIEKERIRTLIQFNQAVCDSQKEFGEKLMILEGWVPQTEKKRIDRFLKENGILFVSEKAKPGDKAPVLLQNNWFGRLFEPIGEIFSLPAYGELDLTVFFAPFFMLFFGFCLGDAGYGFLFILGASLYKLKAPKKFRSYLTLIQFLGVATVIFGTVSGTLFGINLTEARLPFTESIQAIFLDPAKMFNLALILGAVQIIFGMGIKAANQARQFGFVYSLGTLGWLFMILSGVVYFVLTDQKIIQPDQLWIYLILGIGGFFILFFSDPQAGIFMRIGKGIWDIYSTVTGIFGDLLSYIRLFAIGLSSSILGYVINDIGLTILRASPVAGPVLFGLFLLLGHTLNILISSLGSFVHPMRLTFVEFYKNAGFTGGGKAYRPFSKTAFSEL